MDIPELIDTAKRVTGHGDEALAGEMRARGVQVSTQSVFFWRTMEKGRYRQPQSNSRKMMLDDHIINLVTLSYNQRAYPPRALPGVTFDESMHLHFNGERIDLLHFGAAHTTGDAAVIFRGSNAVHLGDVYNEAGYPFIDAGNGGSLDGVIAFCEATLAEIDPDTVVIPGHGPVSKHADLVAYVEMLKTVRGRIRALIEGGATLEEVIAAKPTAEYDAVEGDPTLFVDRAYASLSRGK